MLDWLRRRRLSAEAKRKLLIVAARSEEAVIETHVEESQLPCEWAIPAQPEGQIFDRDKVNVRLTSGDQKTTFVRVASEGACRADAWRFDDPSAPTRILACPVLCERIEAQPQAKLEVLLGCATAIPQ